MSLFSAKGKERATEKENISEQTVRYRHLLTNTMGVLDPLRVIALCDLDAFYAAAERVRLGIDPDRPLAVQQWQGLIAINYPARTFGISRMETVTEAKKKCPDLVLVHVATYKEGESEAGYHDNPSPNTHKVSLDHYRRESMRILKVHQEMIPPGGEIEKASIDEAFFDFTIPVKEVILNRYPHLSEVPSDSPEGLDTPLPPPPDISWDGLGNLILPESLVQSHKEQSEHSGGTSLTTTDNAEEFHDQKLQTTWHDVALAIGAEFMLKMRTEVKLRLGYTTSAGIARNKMLAKLVASYKKLDQQSILRNSCILHYLRPMAFQKIRFLGGKLGDALADEYGAKTVGDVMNVSLEDMQNKFGEESIWVYNALRGIDHSEVKEKVGVKTMMASKNLRPNVTKHEEAVHWLRVLSSELAVRLVEAREVSSSLWPKTLVLHIRQGSEPSRSRQTTFPFSKAVTAEIIAKLAEKLWREMVGTSVFKVHNLALGFSGLGALESGQQGIEGFFNNKPTLVSTSTTAAQSTSNHGAGSKRGAGGDDEKIYDTEDLIPASTTSFICPRCKKNIALSTGELKKGDSITALELLKLEHQDFHLAQDLSREDFSEDNEEPERRVTKKRRKNGQPKGIAKYFNVVAKK